jgi:hypothetical protein
MGTDPIRGKTLRWRYDDGQMAGKLFEHTFASDGTVTYRMADQPAREARDTQGQKAGPHYEVEKVNDTVYAVSYLGDAGYTLTSILDFAAGTVVSFSSNDKELAVQHGTLQPSA